MSTGNVDSGVVTGQQRAYSPNLIQRLLCGEASGNYLRDTSGYGNGVSALNCRYWEPGVTPIANALYTPTVPIGVYYEATTVGGANGATEPNWSGSATPGNTIVSGSNTYTCRALPDLWTGASTSPAQWARWNNGGTGLALMVAGPHPQQLADYCRPPVTGQIDWTSAGATISAVADGSGNTITDSASGFPTLIVGNWYKLTWTSPSNSDNSGYMKCASTAAGTIAWTSPTGITATETTRVCRIQSVLEPASFVWAANIKTTQNGTGNNLWFYCPCTGPTEYGIKITLGTGRLVTFFNRDVSTQTSTLAGSVGLDVGGAASHVAIVVNRPGGTCEFYVNGVYQTGGNLSKRQQCALMPLPPSGTPGIDLMRRDQTAAGTTQLRDLQVYVGRNMPTGAGGLTGTGSPTLITKIYGGTPLSPTDWP